jgi:hypothetical protein
MGNYISHSKWALAQLKYQYLTNRITNNIASNLIYSVTNEKKYKIVAMHVDNFTKIYSVLASLVVNNKQLRALP